MTHLTAPPRPRHHPPPLRRPPTPGGGAATPRARFALAALCLGMVLTASPIRAETVPVELQHDDDKAVGGLAPKGVPLPVGSIFATRFRPDHRLRLDAVQMMWWSGVGKLVELHVWRDNGGLQPGAPEGYFTDAPGADLVPPKKVYIEGNQQWMTWDLTDAKLETAPLEPIWIGARIVSAGPAIGLDTIEQEKANVTAIWQTPSGDCKDGCGLPADLMIRAKGAWLDPIAQRWFADITAQAGLVAGGRVAFGDYDSDGDPDVLIGLKLYRNEGKGTFTDVTAGSGLEGLASHAGLWGDMDNDGHLDLFLFGSEEHVARGKGDGTFTVLAGATFPEGPDGKRFPTEAASWIDVDNDGLIDIYTANYETTLSVCDQDFLWRNKGDGTFEDISVEAGVRNVDVQCGRSVAPADWDHDGDVDLFVGNYRLDPNFFFRNEHPELYFINVASANGTEGVMQQGAYGHTIGAVWADADNDGDFDLFLANLAHPRFIAFSDRSMFYQNLGEAEGWIFSEHRKQTGITYQETQSDAKFADIDNDGWLDLAITNVYVGRLGRFWMNKGKSADPKAWLNFAPATYESGLIIDNGWGSAWADIDGDGDLDYLSRKLYRNDHAQVTGKQGHWFKVVLQGTDKVNRAAIGARATVTLADGTRLTRQVAGAHGVACQDDFTLHFGLGDATQVDKLEVHWPGAGVETAGPFAADQRVVFAEGDQKRGAGSDDAGSTGDAAADAGTVGTDVAQDAGKSKTSGDTGTSDGGCGAASHRPRSAALLWGTLLAALALLGLRRRALARR